MGENVILSELMLLERQLVYAKVNTELRKNTARIKRWFLEISEGYRMILLVMWEVRSNVFCSSQHFRGSFLQLSHLKQTVIWMCLRANRDHPHGFTNCRIYHTGEVRLSLAQVCRLPASSCCESQVENPARTVQTTSWEQSVNTF